MEQDGIENTADLSFRSKSRLQLNIVLHPI